jgi:hypothetical protein
VFLFLALFVVLQVIVKWLRWAGFDDGTRFLLLNWKPFWGMWIIILEDDWCGAFKGMEGGGQGTIIWSWLRKRNESKFFLLGVREAKFQCYLLGSVAFVWIWIVLSWGWKSLWIFLFLNMALDLPLCQEH